MIVISLCIEVLFHKPSHSQPDMDLCNVVLTFKFVDEILLCALIGHSRNFRKTEHYSRGKDTWDRLGNFCELKFVNSYLGNHEPIITHSRYLNDPRKQIAEC